MVDETESEAHDLKDGYNIEIKLYTLRTCYKKMPKM